MKEDKFDFNLEDLKPSKEEKKRMFKKKLEDSGNLLITFYYCYKKLMVDKVEHITSLDLKDEYMILNINNYLDTLELFGLLKSNNTKPKQYVLGTELSYFEDNIEFVKSRLKSIIDWEKVEKDEMDIKDWIKNYKENEN